MIHAFSLLLALVPVARASVESTFKTTCTVPNNTTHYVSAPDTRGTLDILWSCLFTIIACTLTIQHLNVPQQRGGRDPGWWGDLKWAAKDALKGLKWMGITILAPELMIAKGLGDQVAARGIYPKLRDQATIDGVPWTMTHTFFANMGGFVIRSNQEDASSGLKEVGRAKVEGAVGEETAIERGLVPDTTPSDSRLTTDPSPMVKKPTANTFSFPMPEVSISSPPNPYHLLAADILNLREAGQLSRLPRITQDEISDKSKANHFIKIIAVTQILWMVVQILVRTGRKLAVTQLEISVLAFSVCAIIIYLLNWQKPKDVKTSCTILSLPGELSAETIRVLRLSNEGASTYSSSDFLTQLLGPNRNEVSLGAPISNDYSEDIGSARRYFVIGLFLGCATFGGVHVAAWNFGFPTVIEHILWRVASIWCALFAVFAVLSVAIVEFIIDRCLWTSLDTLTAVVFMFRMATSLYVIGRLILLVEVFRTLLFLPPDAFIATSASYIPHIS